MQPSSVLKPRPVRLLVLVLTLGDVLAAGSANAQLAELIARMPDGSRTRAARVLEELQRRACDALPGNGVGRICVDDATAAAYPLGFSLQPEIASRTPLPVAPAKPAGDR